MKEKKMQELKLWQTRGGFFCFNKKVNKMEGSPKKKQKSRMKRRRKEKTKKQKK